MKSFRQGTPINPALKSRCFHKVGYQWCIHLKSHQRYARLPRLTWGIGEFSRLKQSINQYQGCDGVSPYMEWQLEESSDVLSGRQPRILHCFPCRYMPINVGSNLNCLQRLVKLQRLFQLPMRLERLVLPSHTLLHFQYSDPRSFNFAWFDASSTEPLEFW